MDQGASSSGGGETSLPSSFLSATPFVPSFLRTSTSTTEQESPAGPSSPEVSSPHDPTPHSTPNSSDSLSAEQYNSLLELLPSDVQDLLQVNLSHLQATGRGGGSSEEGQQSLRLRAAAATFDQLSVEQVQQLHEAWSLVFGEEDGSVDVDPDATFALRDTGLQPEEEEWFMQQMLEEGLSRSHPRREGKASTSSGKRNVKRKAQAKKQEQMKQE